MPAANPPAQTASSGKKKFASVGGVCPVVVPAAPTVGVHPLLIGSIAAPAPSLPALAPSHRARAVPISRAVVDHKERHNHQHRHANHDHYRDDHAGAQPLPRLLFALLVWGLRLRQLAGIRRHRFG
ncbi:hypothetical protein ACFX19_014566 [Malus domestica]